MELNVRIEELPPMRVASAISCGPSPEEKAWEKLEEWAKSKSLPLEKVRSFGFDNPSPSPGSPNYGYEKWLEVGPRVEGSGEITIKDFPGGRYAVTRVVGVDNIFPTWRKLVAWCEDSPYTIGGGQCLEELIESKLDDLESLTLDLCLPIVEGPSIQP